MSVMTQQCDNCRREAYSYCPASHKVLAVLRDANAYRVNGRGGLGIQTIAKRLGLTWRDADKLLREIQATKGYVSTYVDAPSKRAWYLMMQPMEPVR